MSGDMPFYRENNNSIVLEFRNKRISEDTKRWSKQLHFLLEVSLIYSIFNFKYIDGFVIGCCWTLMFMVEDTLVNLGLDLPQKQAYDHSKKLL